jgi:hypothetical protein
MPAMDDEPATLPQDCRKFQTCNAPICPLDSLWRKAVHLSGEKVCPYLLATGKDGAAEYYARQWELEAVGEKAAEVCAAHPAIARKVQQATDSGFRGGHLKGRRPGVNAEIGGPLLG